MELTERELREKVVAGLAACMPQTEADAATSCSGGCPYFENPCCGDYQDNDHVNLPIRLIEDVRKLLKAQEPRVMTLEEVDALADDAIVWLECLYTVDSKNTTTLKPAIYQPENSSPEEDGYYCVVSSWGKSGFYHKDSYLGDWRCWTSRPTEAQRETVKWDG